MMIINDSNCHHPDLSMSCSRLVNAAIGLRYGINHVYRPRKKQEGPNGDGQRLLDLLGQDEPKYRYAG